ncbi:tyrosine-protein phosphatase [Algoriphagus sp. A40]|uniref:tyrosine-protein phosphatase n=1 Tax=Algoriphagus sp. A40 TaxID=1945863 RepID=UPI0009877925|nr:tyrosine-protein phosphatase [Algoriphagus sp. A40]OOG78670.1 hypothetical protein B0E43_00895 [Algoriphagus sp. A40]
MKRQGEKNQKSNHEASISELIESFLVEFEVCSSSHRRGNDTLFCNSYNRALHDAIKLNDQSRGKKGIDLSCGSFVASEVIKPEHGRLNLHEANGWKRKLLDFFYFSIRDLRSESQLKEAKHFCETVFKRDFLWNFRDISQFNPAIKPGFIFRSSTLTLIQNEGFFEEFIRQKNIKTVIDFRSERETSKRGYGENSLQYFAWIPVPIDPSIHQTELKGKNQKESSGEDTYRFLATECYHSIKKAVEAILQAENSVAIHCHSGKDRTGFFVSLLHLLSGANRKTVYGDYLASEMDTKKEYLDVVLDRIEKENGIENYLRLCGLSNSQVWDLKQKLRAG